MKLLDTVALIEDVSSHHLRRGQVGTIVEELAPDTFEVEFSDDKGQTYALLPLKAHQLMVLYHELVMS
jgi:Domain of unknown function (DUF4926)